MVRRNAARLVTSARGLPNTEAGSIVGAGDGSVYVTSGCSDVFHLKADGGVLDSIPRPESAYCSRSLLLDDRGRLWIGGQGAIRRHRTARASADDGQDTLFTISSFLGEPPGVEVLQADGPDVLFGLSDGRVGRIDRRGRLTFLSGWSVPTDVPVYGLARAADGTVWIAQAGMWSRWQDGALTHFHGMHGVPNAVPRALLPDARGGLWVGTYGGGLWYFRVGSGARPVPLPDRTVSALITDDAGRLWMSGNRGISVVPLAALYRFLADSAEIPGVKLLSYAEGVPEANNGRPAAAPLGGGRLAFASISGLVAVNAAEVLTAGVTPPLRLDVLRTGGGRLLAPAAAVRLAPDDRVLQVEFSAPSFRFADGVRFRYRLDGRDDHWISLGASRELRLAGLRPGRYTLHVEGRAPGGEWRAAPPLVVEAVPLFAEQRWPWLLGGAIAMLLVGLVVRQRLRATQATARAREVELRARRDAAESAEQHQREMAQVSRVAVAGELTASLSHELGQPLAAIVNNAEVARRLLVRQGGAAGVAPAVDEALRDVVLQGHRASQVVREFRRFLRREQGERELMAVRELLESTTLLLRHEFVESRVQLEIRVSAAVPPVLVERVLLQQVFVNLLHNAHEAARGGAPPPRPPQVLVRARAVGGGVRVSVVDSGPGFPPSVRRAAFEPFVTTRPNGMGMGLAIARRVVEAHHGQIRVGRLPGAGAVVSVWLPAGHIPAQRGDEVGTGEGARHG
jgi:signal transduction histidine kinase